MQAEFIPGALGGRNAGIGLSANCPAHDDPTPSLSVQDALTNAAEFRQRKLAVFARNCRMLAERVAVGQIRLIDAADMLQSAAELSGLCEIIGDDVVQQIMAASFTGNHVGLSE